MKKIIFSAALVTSALAYSQTSKNVMVDGVIAGPELIKGSSPDGTRSVNGKTFTNYKAAKSTDNWDRSDLKNLNQIYQLPATNPVIIDGVEYTDVSQNIYGAAIQRSKIIERNGKKYLEIYTSK